MHMNLISERTEALDKVKFFWILLIVVWIASLIYMHSTLMRGWVPHDEGTLAQAAERVMQGELPHRDFEDVYTGGLAFFDSLAFRVLGISLASLRWAMFVFFAAWVPIVYYIASRFAPPIASAAVTFLCVAWSLPNYASPLPSWCNLFFATFGTGCLFRYLEKNGTCWLVAAGMCGGFSCLAKISGLYYVTAVLLFFVFREQNLTMGNTMGAPRRHMSLYRLVLAAGLLIFVIAVLSATRLSANLESFVHFQLPLFVLAAILLQRETRVRSGEDKGRFALLMKLSLPFIAGVLIPISAFVAPYIGSDSVLSLVNGVFIAPAKRLQFAKMVPDTVQQTQLLAVLVLTALLYGHSTFSRHMTWVVRIGLLLGLATAMVLLRTSVRIYALVWSSVYMLVPVAVIAAGTVLYGNRDPGTSTTSLQQQQIFLLSAIVGMCNLVRFPFSAPIYFVYVMPLLVLAILAVITFRERQSLFVQGSLLLFYVWFAVIYTVPGFIHKLGFQSDHDQQTYQLHLPRAGNLKVTQESAAEYNALIPLIQQLTRSRYIYAAPDCPEVYYLSALRNPTRTFYDFFDDPRERTKRIMEAIEAHTVNVVVLLEEPEFSPPVSPDLLQQFEIRFTNWSKVGRFLVRWRE